MPETQTVKVRIIGDDQLALPEWNIVSDTSALPAQCQSFPSPYAIGPNIQYCSPHVDGADVCWAPPGQHFIYCGNTPWDHTVRKIFATDVVSAVPASIDPQPWAIELADGTRCPAKFENGNRQGANGTLALYTCDSRLNVMAKDNDHVIDRSNPIWTVIVGEVDGGTGSTAPPGKRVAVKAVYYAA